MRTVFYSHTFVLPKDYLSDIINKIEFYWLVQNYYKEVLLMEQTEDNIVKICLFWKLPLGETQQSKSVGLGCESESKGVQNFFEKYNASNGSIHDYIQFARSMATDHSVAIHVGIQMGEPKRNVIVEFSTIEGYRARSGRDRNGQPVAYAMIPLTQSQLMIFSQTYFQTREKNDKSYENDRIRARAYNPFGMGDFRGRTDFDRQC